MICRKTKQFTLVELMVVMGVILILVGSMFLLGPSISRKNSESKTKAIMKNVEMLLENYKNSGNDYPLSVERGASAKVDQDIDPTYMPFFLDKYDNDETKDIGMQKYISDETFSGVLFHDEASECDYVADGFGTPLVYYCAGDSYRLISLGANGLIGTGKNDKGEAFVKDLFKPSGKQHDDEGGEIIKAKYMEFAYKGNEDEVEEYFGQGDDIANFTGY